MAGSGSVPGLGPRVAHRHPAPGLTVHGRAVPVDVKEGPFRETLLEVYVPRYGPEWEHDFLDAGPLYARIEADRVFTFHTPADG